MEYNNGSKTLKISMDAAKGYKK